LANFQTDFRAGRTPERSPRPELPGGVKALILQGFSPTAAVAKMPLSGYNMTYFLNAFSAPESTALTA
jgi:hypothetical protein